MNENYSLKALLQLLATKYFPNTTYIIKDGVANATFSQIGASGSGTGTFVKSGDYMLFTDNATGTSFYTEIDVTNRTTIYFECSGVTGNSSGLYGVVGCDVNSNYNLANSESIKSTGKVIYSVDVSAMSGIAYIKCCGWGMSFKVYNVWVE